MSVHMSMGGPRQGGAPRSAPGPVQVCRPAEGRPSTGDEARAGADALPPRDRPRTDPPTASAEQAPERAPRRDALEGVLEVLVVVGAVGVVRLADVAQRPSVRA